MILWLILYASLSFAQDPAVEEYCFSSPAQMKTVLSKSRFILAPSDRTQEDGSCFSISMAPHRRELVQNYVRNIEPGVAIKFSSAELKRDPCHIKVEKTKQESSQGYQAGISPHVQISASGASREATEVTSIQTMRNFSLMVNQDSIEGECVALNPNRYEITITVKKDPVPLIPPVPPGTIVVVPGAEVHKTQKTFKLHTSIQLNRGEKIEIGKVVKDLKSTSQEGSISPSLDAQGSWGKDTEKVFLSLE